MQHAFLRILPVPVNLGARLAMVVIAIALVGLVLALLTFLEVTSLAPIDTEKTFTWVVLLGSLGIIACTLGLWWVIVREVLRPLEEIQLAVAQEEEEQANSDFGMVAVKVQELRDTVHRTQAQLDESHENLRQVEKLAMVGKLAAGMAHSIRNPLTSVKLRLFSLERTLSLTPKQTEDFSVIAEAIRHLDSIVSNFLEFSRRPQLDIRPVSASSVVNATVKLLESRLVTFPVSLSIWRKPGLPDLHADPEQLREALLNIFLNACEAMDYSGNLVVEESLFTSTEGQQFISIRIQDSGPGISPGDMEQLFTPFFSTKEHGTGLGLPIAKGIITEHGGDILVESSPQTGTIFILRLPAVST